MHKYFYQSILKICFAILIYECIVNLKKNLRLSRTFLMRQKHAFEIFWIY